MSTPAPTPTSAPTTVSPTTVVTSGPTSVAPTVTPSTPAPTPFEDDGALPILIALFATVTVVVIIVIVVVVCWIKRNDGLDGTPQTHPAPSGGGRGKDSSSSSDSSHEMEDGFATTAVTLTPVGHANGRRAVYDDVDLASDDVEMSWPASKTPGLASEPAMDPVGAAARDSRAVGSRPRGGGGNVAVVPQRRVAPAHQQGYAGAPLPLEQEEEGVGLRPEELSSLGLHAPGAHNRLPHRGGPRSAEYDRRPPPPPRY